MKIFDSREGYDKYAPHYRKDHAHLDSFDWEAARQAIVQEIEAGLSTGQARLRFLDLGCGDGRILKRLVRTSEQRAWNERLELHGWDISDGMLKHAAKAAGPMVHLKRRDLLDFAVAEADAAERVLPVDRFAVIASFFVLVHIEDPLDFCRALKHLLAPGGRAVFNNIPQRDALVLEADGQKFRIEYCHHPDDAVIQALASTGLTLIRQQRGEWSSLFTIAS